MVISVVKPLVFLFFLCSIEFEFCVASRKNKLIGRKVVDVPPLGGELSVNLAVDEIAQAKSSNNKKRFLQEGNNAFGLIQAMSKAEFQQLLDPLATVEFYRNISKGTVVVDFNSGNNETTVKSLVTLFLQEGFEFNKTHVIPAFDQTPDSISESTYTAIFGDGTYRFVSIGDWGKQGRRVGEIGKILDSLQNDFKAKYILAIGDNFYEMGVSSLTDPQWKTTWKANFMQKKACNLCIIPWYGITGNHDSYISLEPQIHQTYSGIYPNWRFPSEWFLLKHTFLTQSSSLVTEEAWIVNLNTWVMIGGWPFDRNRRLLPDQLLWLDRTLRDAVAKQIKWIIIVGHHTVFSSGLHGNLPYLTEYLLPFLQKYKVEAYICGHDHHLEVLENDDIQFIISGSGSKFSRVAEDKPHNPFSKFFRNDSGFFTHEIVGDEFVSTVVSLASANVVFRKSSNIALRANINDNLDTNAVLKWANNGGVDTLPVVLAQPSTDVYFDYRRVVREDLANFFYGTLFPSGIGNVAAPLTFFSIIFITMVIFL